MDGVRVSCIFLPLKKMYMYMPYPDFQRITRAIENSGENNTENQKMGQKLWQVNINLLLSYQSFVLPKFDNI